MEGHILKGFLDLLRIGEIHVVEADAPVLAFEGGFSRGYRLVFVQDVEDALEDDEDRLDLNVIGCQMVHLEEDVSHGEDEDHHVPQGQLADAV